MTTAPSRSRSVSTEYRVASQAPCADPWAVWLVRARGALQCLGARPWLRFAVLWGISALSAPYAHWAHDSKLYGILVLNRISGGLFADDLFLRFGSQDDYAPFSRLAAPIARVLGVEWTFFVLFLVCDALFVYAMQRMVMALLDEERLATLALLVMVVSPLAYGGLRVFEVHERFFTPRMAACALGFLALERLLRRRHGAALGLAVLSTVAHPLMGFGVLLLAVGCAVLKVGSLRDGWWLMSLAVATLAVLIHPALGGRLFGVMDAQWLDIVRRVTPWNFPAAWTAVDWTNVVVSLGLATAGGLWMLRDSRTRGRVLLLTAAVGAVGLAVTGLAASGSYRLLLQGQPYRALWLAVAVQVPVAVWVAVRLWRRGGHTRFLAVAIAAGLTLTDLLTLQVVVLLFVFPLFVTAQRGLRWPPRREDWLLRSLVGSLIVAAMTSGLVKIIVAGMKAADFLASFDLVTYAGVVLSAPGPIVWLGVVLTSLAALLARDRPANRALMSGGVALAVIVHAASFVLPGIPWYRHAGDPHGRDLEFVQSHLAARSARSGTVPTVYAGAWGHVEYLWFQLHAKSYFDVSQIVGVIFSRETAIEVERRATIVRAFELERFGATRAPTPRLLHLMMQGLFFAEADAAPPTRADVERLCHAGTGIDVAILRQHFGDLPTVSNGRVAVYDCPRVRAGRRDDSLGGDRRA